MPEVIAAEGLLAGFELGKKDKQQLEAGLETLGLAASTLEKTRAINQYTGYVGLMRKWNKAINLVSRQDVDRFVTRHLLDSLSIVGLVSADPNARSVLDIGTGGGLPGIPLAIALPHLQFTLADRSAKKIRFLNQVSRRLELGNTQPIATDVAKLVTNEQRFDVVVSRAVAAPDMLWKLARPLLAPGGRVVLQTQVREQTTDSTEGQEPGNRPDFEWADAQVNVEPHVLQVPGLQSVHDVLVLSQRMPT